MHRPWRGHINGYVGPTSRTRTAIIGRFRSRVNTVISFANMNCCGMSGMCGIDCNHIDPFSIGRRCVPFRAEQWLRRRTRAHALRWQITPRWGCRIRNCGRCLNASRPSMRPLQGRKTAAWLYQGSRPSLADYAPLGLSRSLLWGSSLRHRSVLDWQSMRPLQGRTMAAPLYQGSRLSLAD